MLQGSYAKERVKGTAEETAQRTREAKEAAKERAKEAAERWKGKLRSVVRPSAFTRILYMHSTPACCLPHFVWSLCFAVPSHHVKCLRSVVRPSAFVLLHCKH